VSQVLKMLEQKMKQAQEAGDIEEYERLSDHWQSIALDAVENELFEDVEVSEDEREKNGRILARRLKKNTPVT